VTPMFTLKFRKILRGLSYLTLVCISLLAVSSCGKNPTEASKYGFTLSVKQIQTKVALNEKATFAACLTNETSSDYSITDNGYPIQIFIDKDSPRRHAVPADAVIHVVKSKESLSQTLDFTPTEKGKYILQISAHFLIPDGDANKEVSIKLDNITVTCR